jgi:hypothetical protein
MNYRDQRQKQCEALFAGFVPDVSTARNPELILRVSALATQGYFSHEIAEQTGLTPKAVQKIFRRYNFPRLHNFAQPLREQRIGWKGGIKVVKGYYYARTPGHPNASKHGSYVAVHRLVMEKKLGRYLLPTEVVDHIDGNPANNHPDNLRVFASNGEHLRTTLKGKCPQWSEDGKARLDVSRRRSRPSSKARRTEPTPGESKIDADQ